MAEDIDARVKAALRSISADKRSLTDEDMMNLVRPSAVLEGHITLPNRLKVWFYAVEGWLHGGRIRHCVFRGSCMLIMADNSGQAGDWAQQGLLSTIEALREYHLGSPDPRPMQATEVIAGGRKSNPLATPLIERNPRFHEFLANRFSKTRH